MREIKTCPNQWKQMPTEELDRVLQAELTKERPSEDVVLPILRELREREKDIPVENTPEVIEIREKLTKHNTSSKQSIHTRKWLAAVAAVAAVACIVVMTIPKTVGAESLWEVFARWTSSVFEFFDPNKEQEFPNVDGTFAANNPGLQQLYDKVTELGVTEQVVPTWLPKGFTLLELEDSPVSGGTKVFGKFENDSNIVFITYRVFTDVYPKVEKKTGVEILDAGGIDHFVVENNDSLSITWTVDGVECVINTDLSKEDLYRIIKSIYRSELS